ncbi:ribonuclease R [Peptococcus niger]|uniref:Ribonuclease R n=1 Tax=Peptococcus niger TaxID=2741 RepID=A0A1G6ZFE6_PEPNI|nr:ribonuclease R [Peptococcus niger]SDE01181.1 RNAse R [Peptococcus niger]
MNKEFVLKIFQTKATRPLSFDGIVKLFPDLTKAEKKALQKNIDSLIAEGALVKTRTNCYGLPEQLNLVVGRIKKNKKGFGFLIQDNPDKDDLFIPAHAMNGVLDQDMVIVRLGAPAKTNPKTGEQMRATGEVIRILERFRTSFIGNFESRKHFGFVLTDDAGDIFVRKEDFNGAKKNDVVLVEITKWSDGSRNHEGIIKQVLGKQGAPGIDILSIIYDHHLRVEFPNKVAKAARQLPQKVTADAFNNRHDLRHIPFITVDGADSKDLDDAVQLEVLDNDHYFLRVAIADVGAYVTEDSVFDKEAFKRGTSVYLLDRVLPMLPPELSNGICSLNPGEDRLALVCAMEIDGQGRVVAHEIMEGVIHTKARMTYDDVNAILAGDSHISRLYRDIVPMLEDLQDLQRVLLKKRLARGAIQFDLPESGVRLDADGKPIDIYWKTRGVAERIIEECMIVTNETVAERFFWLKTPFIYRVHEAPEKERLEDVRTFLQTYGYTLHIQDDKIKPGDYQDVLDEVSAEEAYPINMVMLRSMTHAYYSPKPLGHFGLASKYYTHFTSPIRRYSDLAIHRLIKEHIRHQYKISKKRLVTQEALVARYADQASITERMAEEAERDVVALKKVEYMVPHVGDIFPARVVSVTGFGLFVQLDNSVEGLVHISTMVDDFYHFNPDQLLLVGEHSGRSYRLGESVTVRLLKANVDLVQLDFELVSEQEAENEGHHR